MRLSFDSIDEVKEFVKNLKGTRGGKDKDEAEGAQAGATQSGGAPAPIMPNTAGPGFTGPGAAAGFVPPGAGAAPMGGAFPAVGAGPVVDPVVQGLVTRIVNRMDGAVQSGATSVTDMLTWFRGQCGPEAAAATIEQIKANFLPRLSVPALEQIAKMMAA